MTFKESVASASDEQLEAAIKEFQARCRALQEELWKRRGATIIEGRCGKCGERFTFAGLITEGVAYCFPCNRRVILK